MAVSIAAVMRHVRNFFERGCIEGEFTVSGGVLNPMPKAPYVAIEGSMYYDGVYRSDELPNDKGETEIFMGRVWALHPPEDFVSLCEEIAKFDEKNPTGSMQSETFGEYSYNRATVNGNVQGWQMAFAQQLIPYRRMFTEVGV